MFVLWNKDIVGADVMRKDGTGCSGQSFKGAVSPGKACSGAGWKAAHLAVDAGYFPLNGANTLHVFVNSPVSPCTNAEKTFDVSVNMVR